MCWLWAAGRVASVSAPQHLHQYLVSITEYPSATAPRRGYSVHDPRGAPGLGWIEWADRSLWGAGTTAGVFGTFSGSDAITNLDRFMVSPAAQTLRPGLERKRGQQAAKGAGRRREGGGARRAYSSPAAATPVSGDRYSPLRHWDGTVTSATDQWPLNLSEIDTTVAESIEVPLLACMTHVSHHDAALR